MSKVNRRDFNIAAATSLTAVAAMSSAQPSSGRRFGPSDTVRLGFIGVGNRGSQLVSAFSTHADCKVVAVADVFEPYLRRATEKLGAELAVYEDYRKILDRDDIDAVVIATPDHWHALQTVNAVMAKKDVYVEKPLSATIREGQIMVAAAEKYDRVVQVGLQRRSMSVYHDLANYLKQGDTGKITVSRAYRLNNMFPDGIGKRTAINPPAGLNWDLWLGPRDKRPYQDNIAPYKFRWWQSYSSQMGNWGVHYFDVIRWMLGEQAPRSVVCVGGRFAVEDDRTIPDTAEAIFEMPGGSLLVFGQYEANSNPALHWGEVEFRGVRGTIYAASNGFRVLTETPGQFQQKGTVAESVENNTGSGDISTEAHARDFLDCVKNRQTTRCPLVEGHRSTVFAHLANISLATGERLNWDAENEKFRDNGAANEMLHYEYRKGFEMPSF